MAEIIGISGNGTKSYATRADYYAENPPNTNDIGGAQPIDIRLVCVDPLGNETIFTIFDLTKSMSESAIKINTKLNQGSPGRAIRSGTGFIQPNRSVSFQLPIYSKQDDPTDNQIELFSRYVLNTQTYIFFIERWFKGEWWRSEVIIDEMGAITTTNSWTVKATSIKCTHVDNYYLTSHSTEEILFKNIEAGRHDTSIVSETSAPNYPTFKWEGQNPYFNPDEPTKAYPLSIRFFNPNGFGIQYIASAGESAEFITITYDGTFIRVNDNPYIPNGLPPEISNGINSLSLSSSWNTVSFSIYYQNATVL